MIAGADNLRDLFSIFHDGTITHCFADGSNLELDIYIPYLAQQLAPESETFHVSLQHVQELRFLPWPNDLTTEPDLITTTTQIFAPELDILNCELEDGALKVVCAQTSPDWSYCGGELFAKVDAAVVTAPTGERYSIEQLRQLATGYWNNWQQHAGKKSAA